MNLPSSIFFAIMLAIGKPAPSTPGRIGVDISSAQIPRYGRLELALRANVTAENPYDPDEVDLRVELKTPSGVQLAVPAFFHQPFETRPPGRAGEGRGWHYPVGAPIWKVRFTPTELGTYSGTAILTGRSGTARSEEIRFECTAGSGRGFIRISGTDRRYLAFDDGSPFFAVGQNIAFVKELPATLEMIRKLGESGANFARVWACAEDWALAIEARKSAWGRSWAWSPPIVSMPDREGYHSAKLCVRLDAETGREVAVQPSHPVCLRPQTRYRLTGLLKADSGASLSFELAGRRVIAGKPQWVKFAEEFTTLADQLRLPDLRLKATGQGSVWLDGLSLCEADGGPNLLWEADVNRPVLGVYNQVDCHMLDLIVEAAGRAGVYLQIVLLTRDHYMPLLAREDSADYAKAVRYARQLARYCAARWGYSTHVAAWEYFNEMDPGRPTDRFYAEVGRAFEQTDVYRHLRCTSTWSSPSKDYRHPSLETADVHFYLRPANGEQWKDEAASVCSRWESLRPHVEARPFLFSEFGITDDRWQRAPELDKDSGFIHLHNAIWASALSGFAGTVCHWYWDDIHKRDLYHHYRPISRFAADIPWTTASLRPAKARCDGGPRVTGLQNDESAYLWLQDPQATWWNIAVEDRKLDDVRGATVHIGGLRPGRYAVEWWDTLQGEIRERSQALTTASGSDLPVPPFSRDIACKIRRTADER